MQQQAYMKSPLPYYGVSLPAVKALLRPYLRGYRPASRSAWEATIRTLWDETTHREEWYAAIAIGRHSRAAEWRDPASLELWRHLIVTGAWWDVVDEIAGHLVGEVLQNHRPAAEGVIRAWARADDLWLRRTAVLSQHRHKTETDPLLLAEVILINADDASFWLRKAIGWALRDYSAIDPDWVRLFVEEHADQLSPLSKREALRRIAVEH